MKFILDAYRPDRIYPLKPKASVRLHTQYFVYLQKHATTIKKYIGSAI